MSEGYYECECGNTSTNPIHVQIPLDYLPCDKCGGVMWLIKEDGR